jgi:PAS domain S-box-containing protein
MSADSTGTNFHPDAHQQYAQLVASIDGIVWEADARTFQFTFVSSQAERLLSYPLEQWLRPGFWADHIHPDDRDRAVELCRRAAREKRKHDFEYRMLAADGRAVWLRNIVTVVVQGGESTQLRGIMVDRPERKRTEDALREGEELYRLLAENSNDLIYLVGLDGAIVYASPSVGRLLGRVPRSNFEVVHPEDVEAAQAYWERILGGRKGLLTVRVADADGAWHWLEAWSSLIPYHGRPHVLSVCRDVTERKRAEDALQVSHNLLSAVFEATPDVLFVKDLEGRVLAINSAGVRLLGRSRDEILGRDDTALLPPEAARAIAPPSPRPSDFRSSTSSGSRSGSWRCPAPPRKTTRCKPGSDRPRGRACPMSSKPAGGQRRVDGFLRSATYRSGTRVARSSAFWLSAATSPTAGWPRKRCGGANGRREIGWPKSSRSTGTRRSAFSPSTGNTASRA